MTYLGLGYFRLRCKFYSLSRSQFHGSKRCKLRSISLRHASTGDVGTALGRRKNAIKHREYPYFLCCQVAKNTRGNSISTCSHAWNSVDFRQRQIHNVCVCMYVCIYLSMSVCMSVSLYVCLYVCMSVCMSVCISLCMSIYVSMYPCIHVYLYACMYVRMYVCTYVRRYVCMYVCMHACTHVRT